MLGKTYVFTSNFAVRAVMWSTILGRGSAPLQLITSGSLWALKFGVARKEWAGRSPADPGQLHGLCNSEGFSWSSILTAAYWPGISHTSLNSEKGGKEMSSHDSFFHTRKEALQQGVGSDPHFPLTLKISQQKAGMEVVACHPRMDYGLVSGLKTSTETPAVFMMHPESLQFSVLTKICPMVSLSR